MPSEQTGRGSVTSYLNKFCLQVVSRVVLIDVSLTLNQCCSRDPIVRDRNLKVRGGNLDLDWQNQSRHWLRDRDRSRDLHHCRVHTLKAFLNFVCVHLFQLPHVGYMVFPRQ